MSELFLNIVNMSISASWIVLAVLLLRLLLNKAPKWINGILWGIVGLRLIMPFSFESIFSLIPSSETISKAPDSPRPHFESGVTIIDNQVNNYLGEHYYEGVTRPTGHFVDITTILAIVWIVGIVLLLAYTIISYSRVKNKIGTAVLLRDNIYQSENVVSPFVLGIIKPKIYLPFNINEQDMSHVIAHENAHIHRKDHWWKPFGFLVLTLHWFNPLMWLGYVLLCRDIELACDEKVIKELNTEQKADYSQALLTCSVNRRMIAACPLAFGEVGVKDRVKSILNYKKPAFWIIVVAIIASVAVAVCFLTNPTSNKLKDIENRTLNSITEETVAVWVSDGEMYHSIGAISKDLLEDLSDIKISRTEFDADLNNGIELLNETDSQDQTAIHDPNHIELYEVTPADDIQAKYDNEDFVYQKLHYKAIDGTWSCEGYTYKYRLEITGRLSNAAKNTTYIVLSNSKDITFEQTWKASGLSSLMSDYFEPKDAVIVGHKLFS